MRCRNRRLLNRLARATDIIQVICRFPFPAIFGFVRSCWFQPTPISSRTSPISMPLRQSPRWLWISPSVLLFVLLPLRRKVEYLAVVISAVSSIETSRSDTGSSRTGHETHATLHRWREVVLSTPARPRTVTEGYLAERRRRRYRNSLSSLSRSEIVWNMERQQWIRQHEMLFGDFHAMSGLVAGSSRDRRLQDAIGRNVQPKPPYPRLHVQAYQIAGIGLPHARSRCSRKRHIFQPLLSTL
jgi:hypothetical protein